MSDGKAAVVDFLRRCVLYADNSMNRKHDRDEDPEEIRRWQAYRDFTAYSLHEVERGELDDWFTTDGEEERKVPTHLGEPLGDSATSTPMEHLDHQERAGWLAAAIAPRPLMLLSSVSSEGVANLCPVTSVCVLSNHPPLLGVSLSEDRAGRPRDTLVNLMEGGVASEDKSGAKVTVMPLPATWDAAHLVDHTATPIPASKSEWDGLKEEPMASASGDDWPPLHPMAPVALECELVAIHDLPGAVAKLAVLRVENLLHADYEGRGRGPPDPETWRALLCQYGLDRLTAGPDGLAWSHVVRSHRG
jgi:flavin reductase (DIM6/NTAB) family NADH-FMN oxidoreductase RutF